MHELGIHRRVDDLQVCKRALRHSQEQQSRRGAWESQDGSILSYRGMPVWPCHARQWQADSGGSQQSILHNTRATRTTTHTSMQACMPAHRLLLEGKDILQLLLRRLPAGPVQLLQQRPHLRHHAAGRQAGRQSNHMGRLMSCMSSPAPGSCRRRPPSQRPLCACPMPHAHAHAAWVAKRAGPACMPCLRARGRLPSKPGGLGLCGAERDAACLRWPTCCKRSLPPPKSSCAAAAAPLARAGPCPRRPAPACRRRRWAGRPAPPPRSTPPSSASAANSAAAAALRRWGARAGKQGADRRIMPGAMPSNHPALATWHMAALMCLT